MLSTKQGHDDTLVQNQTIWDRSAAGRWLARVLSFELLMISTLMIIPLLMAAAIANPQGMVNDPDIWWHLANARHLFAHGFIRIEPYSFTVAGKPWINSEWLAEVPYWLGYSLLGLHGLLIVTIIAADLNVLGIYLLARQRTGHLWSAFVAAIIGTPLLALNFGARTILWGYICLSLELAILEAWKRGHRRLLWLLPPLFTLWINLHGSWAMGAFLFLLFAVFSHIQLSVGDFYLERRPLPELRQLWIVAALCILAVFINPYGWRTVWYPGDLFFHQKLNISVAQEWQPLRLESLVGKIVALIAVFFLFANGWRRRRWDLFDAFLVAFGVYAAMDHARFCCLLAILATPSLALELHRTFLNEENPNQKRPLLNLAFILAFCLFAATRIPSAAQLQNAYHHKYPTRLIAQIQPRWRVFNSMSVGGLLAFEHKPEFIDTRYDTFDRHGVLKDFLGAIYIDNPLDVLNKYRIDHVLFRRHSPLVYLLLHTSGWKQIGEQNGFVLLARTNP